MNLNKLSILAHSLISALDEYDEDANQHTFDEVQERNQEINTLMGNTDQHTAFIFSDDIKTAIENSTQQTFQSEAGKIEGWKNKGDLIQVLNLAPRRAELAFAHHENINNRPRM